MPLPGLTVAVLERSIPSALSPPSHGPQASDWLDGYLARRTGSSSVFGSYLDPLADKVLIGE